MYFDAVVIEIKIFFFTFIQIGSGHAYCVLHFVSKADADSGPLDMYFDAVVVEIKTFLLLFRLALAICTVFYTL